MAVYAREGGCEGYLRRFEGQQEGRTIVPIKRGGIWRRRGEPVDVGGTASAERRGVRLAQEMRNGVDSNVPALQSGAMVNWWVEKTSEGYQPGVGPRLKILCRVVEVCSACICLWAQYG
jgi:hypothetical protein